MNNKFRILCACFLLSPFLLMAQHSYDVVVYGASPAGVTAAIQVAKMGKSVALLEPSQHLGGIMVEGLGGTDVDNQGDFQNSGAVGGLALEFYRRIAASYGNTEEFEQMLKKGIKKTMLWRFEPHVGEKVVKDWIAEHRIAVMYGARLSEGAGAVRKNGTKIRQMKLENGTWVSGKVFIDATLEGDLLHAAGVRTAIGREANSIYGETKNGIREITDHAQFQVKVDPYKTPGNPASGVIPTIQDEPLGTPGAGDNRLQAYCFRMCLTQDPTNQISFEKPAGYDRSQYEIYLRYEKAGGQIYRPNVSIPNGKTDMGAWHDLSHNLYGMNVDYPAGNYATRQRVFDQHKTFTQGLFYFLANDPEISEKTRSVWSKWGLAKDEFTDNRGWPRQFYVRDARRMLSDYVITEHHVRSENPTAVTDPVAVAYWPPDVHSVRRIIKDGYAYNEGFVFGGHDWIPFGISYRALVPKSTEVTNILTPTCPSSSHIAYGAIRIEFTFMALGQACGTAAVMAIDGKKSVQNVPYEALQEKLLADSQLIDAEKSAIKSK